MAIITLLTDFGTQDVYVGAMKGVIQTIYPMAHVIDLTHEVTPQAIREGAFLLDAAYRYFPAGTIHVVVVDPGVGTARRAIALGIPPIGMFIGPDNGLFTALLLDHPAAQARAIANPNFTIARLGRAISATFHGRDIFAPTAACLASGAPFDQVGPRLDTERLIRLPRFRAIIAADGTIHGEIVHVDRFGNLISNISREECGGFSEEMFATARVVVAQHNCRGIANTYGAAASGQVVALFGSNDLLEVARVNGRADAEESTPTITVGTTITLIPSG
ncbi:MAG TPA: SAM-dependent chlorinase/fluorinase [Thermomicrobiales bacterium]